MPTCGRRHGLSGASWGHLSRPDSKTRMRTTRERTKVPGKGGFLVEPPIGIEPMTYALRGACALPAHALAAPTAPAIALTALAALGLSGYPVHEPVHARGRDSLPRLLPVAIIEDSPRSDYPARRSMNRSTRGVRRRSTIVDSRSGRYSCHSDFRAWFCAARRGPLYCRI